jgi:hypothetical protein
LDSTLRSRAGEPVMHPQPSPGRTLPSEAAAEGGSWVMDRAEHVLAAAIVAAMLFKFLLVTRININWDEFYFLEMVHQYADGNLSGRFQTFHVHLFSWLPALGWSDVDQIIAGRFVLQVLAAGSAYLIYAIARAFCTRAGAMFALLAYLSLSAVIEHGNSFRVDPIVTFLSLLSLFAILRRPGGSLGAVLAGATMALAILVTVKSAFYLVVIGGVLACVASGWRGRVQLWAAFATSFAATIAPLYLFHTGALAERETVGAASFLGSSASKMFLDGVFPRAFDFIWMLILNPLFWILLVQGAMAAWARARRAQSGRGWQALLPLVLAMPILTPMLYRNAFPYFFPFILAPAAVLVGIAFDKHREGAAAPIGIPPAKLAGALVLVQCAIMAFGSVAKIPDKVQVQRETLAVVRSVFPQPVPYIEGFGILADYPRVGFFMSSWGVENYRRGGQPVFAGFVARHQPPFVLADSPSLYAALVPGIEIDRDRALLPDDAQFLQENYIPHWGMLFVAGKQLRSTGGADTRFDVAVAGDYRLEAAAPVTIDGNHIPPGGTVTLAAGSHLMAFDAVDGAATLRWAAAAHVPAPTPLDPLTFFDRKSWAGMTPAMVREAAASQAGNP